MSFYGTRQEQRRVAKEIEWAEEVGIPVLELPTQIGRRVLAIDQAREVLLELGQR